MYKPLKTAYQDEGLSIFTLTQDPTGNPDSDVQETHVKLKKRISEETIKKLQQKRVQRHSREGRKV